MIKLSIRETEKQFNKLRKNIDRYSVDVQKRIDLELNKGAEAIELAAKNYAPKDRSRLVGSIKADHEYLTHTVKVSGDNLSYAGYMEFGTKRYFNSRGRPNIARDFKGRKGGTYAEFVFAIFEWVKRKGIAGKGRSKNAQQQYMQVAYAIADKIMRYGVQAANKGLGYFFRAYDEERPKIAASIKKVISYKA